MKTAAIINIGSELLSGKTLNSHSHYLAKYLSRLGWQVKSQISCADNREEMLAALTFSAKQQLVIITGGLGPTVDDITREVVADFLQLPLVENEVAKCKIEAYFKNIKQKMSKNNYRQALFPLEADILDNQKGTADGFCCRMDNKLFIALPGPKRELEYVFEQHCIELLTLDKKVDFYYYKFFGIGESLVDQKIGQYLINNDDITMGIYASDSIITLALIEWQKTEDTKKILKDLDDAVNSELSEFLYAKTEIDLKRAFFDKLISTTTSISFAESCTGGMLAANITEFAGASAIFDGSVVTYSNQQKQNLLNVSSDCLNQFGAVSAECCQQMVEGLKDQFHSDMAIAITGIAGPTGGSKEKPVGLVYIGIDYKGKQNIFENRFSGSRARIRNKAMLTACFKALKILD